MFCKQFNDDLLVAAYLKYESQIKAAHELGCSRETVARAVRRAGIPLNGRRNTDGKHRGNGGGGSDTKLADADLIEDSRKMTRAEISQKYNVDIMNIIRKEKRLGISCASGFGAGGKSKWKKRASGKALNGFDDDITLLGVYKRDGGICRICGLPVVIEKKDGWKTHKDYPSIDHIIPLSKGGTHTWDNVQLAHISCNSAKGDKEVC